VEWVGLILAVSVFFGVLPAVREQYRTDPKGFWKTVRVFVYYLGFVALGIFLTLWLLSGGDRPSPQRAVTAFVFAMSYILYAAVWLARVVPRYRELPAWFDCFPGAIDYVFWALIGGAFLIALGSA
jgi:hypothetical protein